MDDPSVLVFSDAGGTGRSYHAELSAKNQRLRVHYLLEPGWKADAAIQGLGRTNRTTAQLPLFRRSPRTSKRETLPVHDRAGSIRWRDHARSAPDRRPGPVLPEDNLESSYARARCGLYLLIDAARSRAARWGASSPRPA